MNAKWLKSLAALNMMRYPVDRVRNCRNGAEAYQGGKVSEAGRTEEKAFLAAVSGALEKIGK